MKLLSSTMLWVGIWTLQVIVGVDADAPSCRYTDNFDDLDGASLLPQFSNVNTYNGVTFEAFTVSTANNITGTIGGLIPHSAPQAAGFTMITDVTQLLGITLHPFGYLVPGEGVESIDLFDFYFGCTLDTHTPALDVSQPCTISVCGYSAATGDVVPCVNFPFVPSPSILGAEMAHAVLPDTFRGLSEVIIAVDTTLLDFVTTSQSILFVDDVTLCNH